MALSPAELRMGMAPSALMECAAHPPLHGLWRGPATSAGPTPGVYADGQQGEGQGQGQVQEHGRGQVQGPGQLQGREEALHTMLVRAQGGARRHPPALWNLILYEAEGSATAGGAGGQAGCQGPQGGQGLPGMGLGAPVAASWGSSAGATGGALC